MTQVVKVAKIGKSTNSVDPNDFIFHSEYNTFKIVFEDTATGTIDASSTITIEYIFSENGHPLNFIPLVSAFAKQSDLDQVFLPNGLDVEFYGAKLGFDGNIKFNYVSASQTSAFFNFTNTTASDIDVSVKFYVLERV